MFNILTKVPVLTNLHNNYSVTYLMRTHSSITMNTQNSEGAEIKRTNVLNQIASLSYHKLRTKN
jgi:hypothetical protein